MNMRTDLNVTSGETTTVVVKLVPDDMVPKPSPDTLAVEEIVEPLLFPDPDVQPFAAGTVEDEFIISALFPAYASPVWIFLAVDI